MVVEHHVEPERGRQRDAAAGQQEAVVEPLGAGRDVEADRAVGPGRGAAQAALPADCIPEYVGRRLISVRAYDALGWMTDAAVCAGVETAAIRNVFGASAYSVPVSSTKSMHGHALGATLFV